MSDGHNNRGEMAGIVSSALAEHLGLSASEARLYNDSVAMRCGCMDEGATITPDILFHHVHRCFWVVQAGKGVGALIEFIRAADPRPLEEQLQERYFEGVCDRSAAMGTPFWTDAELRDGGLLQARLKPKGSDYWRHEVATGFVRDQEIIVFEGDWAVIRSPSGWTYMRVD